MRIENLKIPPEPPEERRKRIEKLLQRQFGRLPSYRIVRRSVDARRRGAIRYVYTIDVQAAGPPSPPGPVYEPFEGFSVGLPAALTSSAGLPRPVIVGFGPAGMFCALLLTRAGLRPLVLEQGAPVEERTRDVEAFWAGGALKPWSNVQFGEGGAGTFSDGKLNTGIKDPSGRIPFVLKTMAEGGADASVLYDAHPHVGTDVLVRVVRHIREEILAGGGEIRFHSRMESLLLRDGRVCGVRTADTRSGETEDIPAQEVILAIGHSARETFAQLQRQGVSMQPKAFAVGVRIQHRQRDIDRMRYGEERPAHLPPADYKLTARSQDGRGVYSFCMCPGGEVVNASSEAGRLCVNGMSRAARDGENANSALIVQVGPEDFEGEDPLCGMRFQRRLEEAAFRAAGGSVPLQRLEDFEKGRSTQALGRIIPAVRGPWALADLNGVLPQAVRCALKEAMPQFDRSMPGFADPDALLAGIEARTSSPVTILRDEGHESPLRGLYPCGEGAGYAGGITSAAVDGLKTAEKILRRRGIR